MGVPRIGSGADPSYACCCKVNAGEAPALPSIDFDPRPRNLLPPPPDLLRHLLTELIRCPAGRRHAVGLHPALHFLQTERRPTRRRGADCSQEIERAQIVEECRLIDAWFVRIHLHEQVIGLA